MNKNVKKIANDFIKKVNVHTVVYAKEGGVIYLDDLLVDFEKFLKAETKDEFIKLSELELITGINRQDMAEALIVSMPEGINRNNWLMKYGYNSDEGTLLRREQRVKWDEETQAAKL